MKKQENYSFRAFLHEILTKKEVRVAEAQGMVFLLTIFTDLAIVIALYNAVCGV